MVSIRLDAFSNFKEDVQGTNQTWVNVKTEDIERSLTELIERRLWTSNAVLYQVLINFAFFLCRFQIFNSLQPENQRASNQRSFITKLNAEKLFRNLNSNNYQTTWLVGLNNRLNFQQRFDLLQLAIENFTSDLEPSSMNLRQRSPGKKEREFYWWTVVCYFDLALRWFKSHQPPEPLAKVALYEASITYLQILKDDPRHESLENFLEEMGSNIENEVERVFNVGNNSVLKDDEVLNRTFIAWFLRRYNYNAARNLNKKRTPAKYESGFITTCCVLTVISFSLFFLQGIASLETSTFQVLWSLQIAAQLLIPLLLFIFLPNIVKLLFPKAIFGTLLAWTTVFITAIPDLQGLEFKKDILIQSCECGSIFDVSIFLISFLIITALLSSLLILYFVAQFTKSPVKKIKRVLPPFIALLFFSLYWGIMFTLPVNHFLHSKVQMFMFTPINSTICFFIITIIGSMSAIFFGLLIQLIWQNESIAEPMGEPI